MFSLPQKGSRVCGFPAENLGHMLGSCPTTAEASQAPDTVSQAVFHRRASYFR